MNRHPKNTARMATLIAGATVLLAGCSMAPQPAPLVTWQYGTGNGESTTYSGPAPAYSRTYGMGNGEGVTNTQQVTAGYAYGADGMSGTMIQLSPQQRQMMAAPAPATQPAPATAVGTHS